MNEKSARDVQGLEYDWIASDVDGNVAFFSTGGGGYAPRKFLEDTDAHDSAIETILGQNPRTRASRERPLQPEYQDTWKMMAERGFFAYDSGPLGGAYRLVAAPESPVSIDTLPPQAVEVASRLVFRAIRFSEHTELRAEQLDGDESG